MSRFFSASERVAVNAANQLTFGKLIFKGEPVAAPRWEGFDFFWDIKESVSTVVTVAEDRNPRMVIASKVFDFYYTKELATRVYVTSEPFPSDAKVGDEISVRGKSLKWSVDFMSYRERYHTGLRRFVGLTTVLNFRTMGRARRNDAIY